jgi:ribosome-associated protein
MALRHRDFLALGRLAAACADEKKALDIMVLDVGRLSSVSEFFVLASVESQPQLQAVYQSIRDRVDEIFGLSPLRRDGVGSAQWLVLDYGGVVVHLFHKNAREFYGLERLWEGSKTVEWREKRVAAKRARPKTRPGKARHRRTP